MFNYWDNEMNVTRTATKFWEFNKNFGDDNVVKSECNFLIFDSPEESLFNESMKNIECNQELKVTFSNDFYEYSQENLDMLACNAKNISESININWSRASQELNMADEQSSELQNNECFEQIEITSNRYYIKAILFVIFIFIRSISLYRLCCISLETLSALLLKHLPCILLFLSCILDTYFEYLDPFWSSI